jgi:hypothetical protein
MSAKERATEAYRLALEGRRRRAADSSKLTRAEVTSFIAANQRTLEAALARTPFVPLDDLFADTGVVTREEAAIMHRAARKGFSIDFIPLNARIRLR